MAEKRGKGGKGGKGKAKDSQIDDTTATPETSTTHHHPPSYDDAVGIPTISSPFHFPAETDLPSYSTSSCSTTTSSTTSNDRLDKSCSKLTSASTTACRRPVAIPQLNPDSKSPFVRAYSHTLLHYGIPEETWSSFLDTMSAFLTAKVSDRAVSHAADTAKHLAQKPKSLGQDLLSHVKSVEKGVTSSVKRGNIFGAAMGAVGGAIGISLHAALGTAGAVISMPGSAIGALARKPQTPLQRAMAYAIVANEKWLRVRGLQAQLLDTSQLADLLGLSTTTLLEATRETKDSTTSGRLKTLEGHIASLEAQDEATLHLSDDTIWLVLLQVCQEPTSTASTS